MPLRDLGQELGLDVLADQPVITAERARGCPERAALPQVQRRQVQPGRPPLGPAMQLRHLTGAQRQARIAQQRRRLGAGQRQVSRADLQEPAFRAQPRHPQRRLGPPGQHQPGAVRHMIGQHRHRGPALLGVQQVHVIQHQHNRHGHRRERRPQPGHHRARHRTARGGQHVEHPAADRLDGIERRCDVGEQDLRVVVPLVDRDPGEGRTRVLGPLRQQRRLAVARRGDHRDDPARVPVRQPVKQRRTAYGPGPHQRL